MPGTILRYLRIMVNPATDQTASIYPVIISNKNYQHRL